jgi:hypothetical protein
LLALSYVPMFFCYNAIFGEDVPQDGRQSSMCIGCCWFVAFLICLIVWIVLMNQPSPSPPTIIVGGIVGGLILVTAGCFFCIHLRRDQSTPPTTITNSTIGSTPSPTKLVDSNPNTSTQKALRALEEDGFSCRALSPQTDASVLQLLEALLQTEHPEWLRKGQDVSKTNGPYDSLKLACAWKVDHPRNLDKYKAGKKRVQEELERLQRKGKNVSNVPGLPVKTARVSGFTLSQACNEVILLHGTNPDRLLDLLVQGLNEHYSGTGAGTAFGDGVYLAEDAGKTDQYVSVDSKYDPSNELHKRLYGRTVPHPGDVFYVLVVRAALGYPVRTQRTLDNSPEAKTHELRAARVKSMDNNAPVFPINCRELSAVPDVMPKILHHSLIAELGKHIVRYREFVLFHSEYVHIDYVIAYHRCRKDSPYQA